MGKIKSFKALDKVTWKTGVCGIYIKKIGKIVCILEPGEDFYIAAEDLKKSYRAAIIYNGPPVRDHISYIVMMKEKDMISKIYWPDVKLLKKYKPVKRKKVGEHEKIEEGKDWGEDSDLQGISDITTK